MSSLLIQFDTDARRALLLNVSVPHVSGVPRDDRSGLVALAQALRAEIAPLFPASRAAVPLPIPEVKARLTKKGGRCAVDGMLLEFDPWSPHEHRCRQCARVYTDFEHHEWWAMGAQLWTAERAVQAAALALLCNDAEAEALSLRILAELAARYVSWPNKDNALGPSRPFFSTYLESIWLLNLCHAIALLEQCGGNTHHDGTRTRVLSDVREQLVMPSRELVTSFPEGLSNRQVWNEVAILSASRILGDNNAVVRRLDTRGGLLHLFEHGLLADGTWYEGENYHLFAHRGLWYATQLLATLDRPLPEPLATRFNSGFVTPFLGLLPDDTIPSRRDSQYRVSVRQWRFAEWCELGIVALRAGMPPAAASSAAASSAAASSAAASSAAAFPATSPEVVERCLAAMLARLYRTDDKLTAQHRHAVATADAERNEPAGLLSRADLSWRALLLASERVPVGASWTPGSVCLPRQGLAVVRRDEGQVYISLEGGHTGGGHGHPDRLALTLQRNQSRWTEDPGTGSYVDRALHWYRSTLAHAAPLVDGASQDAVPATLLAFEDRGGAGWMCKRAENVKPGVHVQRTIVVCDGYLLDVVEWEADRAVQFDLPLTRNAGIVSARGWTAADAGGAGGLEDGFDFLTDAQVATAPDETRAMLVFTVADDPNVVAQYFCSTPAAVWRASAPGAPGSRPEQLHWFRTTAPAGCMVGVWSWTGCTWSLSESTDGSLLAVRVVTPDGTAALHTRNATGWHIALSAGHATSSIQLEYLPVPEPAAPEPAAAEPAAPEPAESEAPGGHAAASTAESTRTPAAVHQLTVEAPALFMNLGEPHYRRTEQSWQEAGKPTASLSLEVNNGVLDIGVLANTGPIVVPEPDEPNVLDNERPDVNADGLELFLATRPGAPWAASWLIVPAGDDIYARVTPTTVGSPEIACAWAALAIDEREGWGMRLQIPLAAIPQQPDGTFAMEIIVNERPAGRQRRRGQLVMSGGGEFAYLRGDRSDSAHAHEFRLPQSTQGR